jgi:hypothetical protein
MSSKGRGAAPRSGRRRLHLLAVVIGVMVLLTAGWPLLNLVISDNRSVAANAKLTVGVSNHSSGTVTMGPGWTMLSAQSDPQDNYSLVRGPTQMSLDYVPLINSGQIPHLWDGLRRVEEFDHPGATLSEPVPITSAQGYQGQAGVLSYKGLVGTAAIFPSPSGKFAIEMAVLSPPGSSPQVLATITKSISSLRFRWGLR